MTRIEIDLITQEVLEAALISAAQEMGGALKFSSYSPIIRDMEDFSCAIFTSDGDLVAQADYIPAQLGAMSLVVKSVISTSDHLVDSVIEDGIVIATPGMAPQSKSGYSAVVFLEGNR